MRSQVLLLMLVWLAACQAKPELRQAPTAPVVVTPAPAVIGVPEVRYVEIPARLTKRCAWVRDGQLEEALDVARGRKKCLEFYEANVGEIEQIQGTPVPEGSR